MKVTRLTLKQADGDLERDRRVLFSMTRPQDGSALALTYLHLRRPSEPGLWVADAVAWAWTKGGDWRRRLDPLKITEVDADQ